MPLYTYVYSPTGQYVDASGRRVAVLKNGDPVPGDACCNTCGSTSCGCDAGAASPGWSNSTDETTYLAAQGLSEATSTGTSCGLPPVAEGVAFDNEASGLVADTVQAALDELAAGGGGGGASASDMVGAGGSTDGQGGLVPQPMAGDNAFYLRGDGTWALPNTGLISISTIPGSGAVHDGDQTIYTTALVLNTGAGIRTEADDTADDFWLELLDFVGATPTTAGVRGAVPPPAAGDEAKYLRADGTWQTISVPAGGAVSGFSLLSPGLHQHADGVGGTYNIDTRAPSVVVDPSSFNNLLSGSDDTVQQALETLDQAVGPMVGAGVSSNGGSGVVPAPIAGQNKKYLRGDGTWAQPGMKRISLTASAGAASGDAIINLDDEESPTFVAAEGISLSGNDAANQISFSVADFSGATPTNPGVRGAVPQPPAGADDQFLRGDGGWAEVVHQVELREVPTGFPDSNIEADDVLYTIDTYGGASNTLNVNVSGIGTGTKVREIMAVSTNDYGNVTINAPAGWSINGAGNSLVYAANAGDRTIRAVTRWSAQEVFITSY